MKDAMGREIIPGQRYDSMGRAVGQAPLMPDATGSYGVDPITGASVGSKDLAEKSLKTLNQQAAEEDRKRRFMLPNAGIQ